MKKTIISILILLLASTGIAAVANWGGNTFTGSYLDTKPTNVPDGSRFFETDSPFGAYIKSNGSWTLVSSASGTMLFTGAVIDDVRENNVSSISKGQAVYSTGGAVADRVRVALANTAISPNFRVIGLAISNITQNGNGQIISSGSLHGVDTRTSNIAINPNGETWNPGDRLYLSSTNGGLSNVRPTSGRTVQVGYTVKGNSAQDDIIVAIIVNPVWQTAASGEDVINRLGDSVGANKLSIRNYTNTEVAWIDSNGTASFKNLISPQGVVTYYYQGTASDVSGYNRQIITPYSPKTTVTFNNVSTGSTITNFITDAGIPNTSFIAAGTFEFHIHASKSGGGTAQLYAEIWEENASGVDIAIIGSTEVSPAIATTETEYRMFLVTANTYTLSSASSRVVTRIRATTTSTPNISIYFGGEADSHTSLPGVTVDSSNFIPYTGATLDIDLGSHNLKTSGSISANVTGNASTATFATSAGTASTALTLNSSGQNTAGSMSLTTPLGESSGGTGTNHIQWKILPQCVTTVSSTVTGTTAKTTLFSCTVPGGSISANGKLTGKFRFEVNNNGNAKTITVEYAPGTAWLNLNLASTLSYHDEYEMINRNSASVQIGSVNKLNQYGTSGSPHGTAAVNTAIDQTLLVSCTLANASDYCVLKAFDAHTENP